MNKCEYSICFSFSDKDGVEIVKMEEVPNLNDLKLRARKFGFDEIAITKTETVWHQVN